MITESLGTICINPLSFSKPSATDNECNQQNGNEDEEDFDLEKMSDVDDGDASDEESFWGGVLMEESDNTWDEAWEWADPHLNEVSPDDDTWRRDCEDLRAEIEKFATDLSDLKDLAASQRSENVGTQPLPSTYEFCPLAHRASILRIFSKHASQHSLLPERHGQPRSATDIWRDAVTEMYQHCERNNLPDVWAYLWVNWYALMSCATA